MNLKSYESNGLECISVNYINYKIMVSAAKVSGGHDKIGLLHQKSIASVFLCFI